MQVELGDDLLRQVGIESSLPEGSEIKQLKFDAKGTAHVLVRNGDEKLIKDIPIVESPTIVSEPNFETEVLREYNELKSKNEKDNHVATIVIAILMVTALFCVAVTL